jgi:hypothetical protein
VGEPSTESLLTPSLDQNGGGTLFDPAAGSNSPDGVDFFSSFVTVVFDPADSVSMGNPSITFIASVHALPSEPA